MKRKRVIDTLRKQFPDLSWRYEWPSTWVSSAGWEVCAYSAYTPRYDGDDDTFATEYRRSDTGELLLGLRGGTFRSWPSLESMLERS